MRIAVITLAFALACQPAWVSAGETAQIMRDVYDAIAYLLPLSVRDPSGQSAFDQELIDKKLNVLANATSALAAHADGPDREFSLLARSFDRLAQDTVVSFRENWPDYAYYSLMELADHCASCHARMPTASQAWFGARLMARMNLENLTDMEKASLYRATRQFDAALSIYESALLSAHMDPVEAEYRGLLTLYMRTIMSVDDGFGRAAKFLAAYAARPDIPYFLAQRLAHWRAVVAANNSTHKTVSALKSAEDLFDSATAASLAPGSRARVVEDLLAARMLRNYLQANPSLPADIRAGIYYRLAVVALRTNEADPGVPEMEMLLVAAIESDPGGVYAGPAYSMLEEFGYVQEEHLAQQNESRGVIDMKALRRTAGLAD